MRLFGILFAVFGLFSPYLHANELYGQASLRTLQGVEVFVHLSGDPEIKKMENEIKDRLKTRLEYVKVPIIPYNKLNNIGDKISNSGALKFFMTGFKQKDGDYIIYATLQLHQRAYLAVSHEYMDCPTWDTWKMGVFKDVQVYLEVEDMIRDFTNDFIAATGF